MDAAGVLQQALASLRAGRFAEAESALRALLRVSPGDLPARQLLGMALMELGRPAEALAALDAVVAHMPSPQLHFNRGNALASLGRMAEAAQAYGRAVALNPEFAQAHLNGAMALRASGRHAEAVGALERALEIAPDSAAGWQQLGSLRLQLGRDEAAIQALQRAIGLQPRRAATHNELGVALHRLGRAESALAAFDAALALQPADADALNNRGNALHDLRRIDEALACFDAALGQRPDFPEATCNRGTALQDLRRFEEAECDFDRALALRPRYAEAMRRRAALRLLLGRFEAGWADYETAHEMLNASPAPARRWWRGESLAGKSILLSEPNGIGDILQFLRFVPRLFEMGAARVSFAGPARFRRLLGSFDPRLHLVDEVGGSHDYHCWLWGLPHCLRAGGELMPIEVPYLHAEAESVARWSAILDPSCINIGISWQGNPARRIDRGRSIPLPSFAPLARVPGVRLWSLQKNFGVEQLATLPEGMQVLEPGAGFDEGADAFLDSAGLLQGLDLAVSSDTSLVHLAGALGRPVWVALSPVPEWRWQLDREDSPWYPQARLFRQRAGEDWAPVFERMAQALEAAIPALRAARSR